MNFSIRRVNEWLIFLLVLIGLPALYSFAQNNLDVIPDSVDYFFNIQPTQIIVTLATVDAINIFEGQHPQGYSLDWKTISIYVSLILFLMVGPYLLFKGYKKAKDDATRAKPWYWYIGGAICIWAISIVPTEIYDIQRMNISTEGAEKNRIRDMMRDELVEVGYRAAQFEITEDGVQESFKIEDLNLTDLNFDYAVESNRSDTLLAISVSSPEYPELGYRMEVRPYSKNVLRIRN